MFGLLEFESPGRESGARGQPYKNLERDFEGQYSARRIFLKFLRTKQMRSCHTRALEESPEPLGSREKNLERDF